MKKETLALIKTELENVKPLVKSEPTYHQVAHQAAKMSARAHDTMDSAHHDKAAQLHDIAASMAPNPHAKAYHDAAVEHHDHFAQHSHSREED